MSAVAEQVIASPVVEEMAMAGSHGSSHHHGSDKVVRGRKRDAVADGIMAALFGVSGRSNATDGESSDVDVANFPFVVSNPNPKIEDIPLVIAKTDEVHVDAAAKAVAADRDGAAAAQQGGDEPKVVEEHWEERPRPEVPGMADANLVVSVECEKQKAEPETGAGEAVGLLMRQSGGDILAAMAQDGWSVEPIDPSNGIYELSLPAVEYNVGPGTVSIPSPRFRANVVDVNRTDAEGDAERLVGDLILQNGEDILTVTLGFPFSTTIKVSAAGSARARIGQSQDTVYLQADVEIGLQIPKVPGLVKIMQLFVKNYANKSTFDCAVALSKGADKLAADEQAELVAKSAVAAATAAAAMAATEVDVVGMAVEAGRMAVQGAGEVMMRPGMEELAEVVDTLADM